MGTIRTNLSNKPWILALIISLLLIVWMSSGQAEQVAEQPEEKAEQALQKVQAERFIAEPIAKTIALYGRSEPDRQATLKAEVHGRIVEVFEKRGAEVKKGEPLARIAINDLEVRLSSAKALVRQRAMEYKGLKSLSDKGLQDESRLSLAEANLAQAKAEVRALEISIENTLVVAPFDGVVNERFVEVGDFVQRADPIAQVVDLNPLIIRVQASEIDVNYLSKGQAADAKFVNGQHQIGKIRYIASLADTNTNTFEVEIAINNDNRQWKAGASAEVDIALNKQMAIKVTPAVLALDENGSIGIKSVKDGVVNFSPIEIIKSEEDGVWLSGLGDQADIITLGQGFVREGDQVDVSYKAVN
ncbi:efflux RND transporter periplasmic adaptor subunit [Catenovulum sp. SM1970]|uniref:efflux RND transporter periplasmic adaptor subunit n=1 Tax=Marinifaba aquimaris TaxID=2741323 RepID=UPI00157212B8|nr:efflux RND transporter periplasmic adaptor subunit [Marinifaba aquimaris]NTS77419.1 efflux RND transporter periplasmic adaptor subunit [Marinifaba aquimaris]